MVILCIQAYLDRGYFWVLFQLPPAIIYKNISRYRNVIKIDNDQKLVLSYFFLYIYYFYSFNLTYIKYKYAKYAVY